MLENKGTLSTCYALKCITTLFLPTGIFVALHAGDLHGCVFTVYRCNKNFAQHSVRLDCCVDEENLELTGDFGRLAIQLPHSWNLDRSPLHRKFPSNRPLNAADILYGWEPREKFISRQTRVLAFGSCFAEHFIGFLLKHGYNRRGAGCEIDESWFAIADHFESALVVLQQFQWAFGQFTPPPELWFTRDKRYFDPTEERRQGLRKTFENSDVFVITLGLSEVWFHQPTNQPMWRSAPSRVPEQGVHTCRRVTVAETVAALRDLARLADEFLPDKRFIFTLSPIPMSATFRNQSVVTANQVSKAILRAALDEFFADQALLSKSRYYYFPSYELVLHLFDRPYQPDNLHVRSEVVASVLDIFRSVYTDLPADAVMDAEYVRMLETRVADFTQQLIEKERVIRDLDLAARERLALLERLSAETKPR